MNMNIRKATGAVALSIGLLTVLPACNTSKGVQGGAIGAGAGAGIGAVIGNQFPGQNGTAIGAIIGAAVGGTTGALIGRHMDKQAEELQRDLEGATVTRVGEGIKITFDSGLLFGFDQSTLSSEAQNNLVELSTTLKKYDDTDIIVEGHTDADGSDTYNQDLSVRRAKTVGNYLIQNSVSSNRLTTVGYGETQPLADNTTDAGKAANRRVEIAIFANKRMKKAAEKGEL